MLSRGVRDTIDLLSNEITTSLGNTTKSTETLQTKTVLSKWNADEESLHLEKEGCVTKRGASQQPTTVASAVHSRSQLPTSSYRRLPHARDETRPKERTRLCSKEIHANPAERSRQMELLQDGAVIRRVDADDETPQLNEMSRRIDVGAQPKPILHAHELSALHDASPPPSSEKTHQPPRVIRVWYFSGKLAVEINSCDIPLMTVADIINRFRHAESIPSDRVRMLLNGDDLDASTTIQELLMKCPCHALDIHAIVMPSSRPSRITTPTQMPLPFDVRDWFAGDADDGDEGRHTFESDDNDDDERERRLTP